MKIKVGDFILTRSFACVFEEKFLWMESAANAARLVGNKKGIILDEYIVAYRKSFPKNKRKEFSVFIDGKIYHNLMETHILQKL